MMMRLASLLLAAVACSSGAQVERHVERAERRRRRAARGTVIVANMGDNTATLIDVASKRVVATLPTGNGAHEVAVSHDGRWAVVSNYGVRGAPGNTLTVIDVPAAVVTRTIDLGEFRRPHGSAFLPGDSLFVVTSEMSKAIVLVNFNAGTVAGSIPTNHPASHMLALTADGRRIYTSNIADGTVSEIDVPGRKFVREYNVAPAVEGIAVSARRRAGVGPAATRRKPFRSSTRRPARSAARSSGFGMPYRLAVTPDSRTVVITDPPNAVVRIVDRVTRQDRATVKIPAEGVRAERRNSRARRRRRASSLSRDGRYGVRGAAGQLARRMIDIAGGTIVGYVPTGAGPDGIAYSPFGR